MKKILFLPARQVFLLFVSYFIFVQFYEPITYVYAVLFALSVYTVASNLNQALPEKHNLNFRRFVFLYSYTIIYSVVVGITVGGYEINSKNIGEYGWKAAIIIPLHFSLMFSMIYCFYFISRAIATIEQYKRNGSVRVFFGDYIGYLFLVWFFFPIGVWWIQPKINKIFMEVRPTS